MHRLGLIGGTGLDQWGQAASLHEIDGAYGRPSAGFSEYQVGDLQLFFLPRHGAAHEFPPHAVNYQANIDAFRQLEVEGIIAVNAVGGISRQNQPGVLTVPDQLIDYTWGRAHSFSMTAADPLQHTEFAGPFDGALRSRLVRASGVSGVDVLDGGCIGVTQGPRLETAAEIQKFKRDGCDLVGMTTMPEAALAREAGLDYACLCINANLAAGLEQQPVTMAAIEATLEEAMTRVRKLLMCLFEEYASVH
jgi:5'-methylthioinosine phosphorylase